MRCIHVTTLTSFSSQFLKIINKVLPRHPYRTRALTRVMDELEKQNVEMRNNIDEMKIQMSEILEKLDALGRKEPEGTPQGPVYGPSYQLDFNPVQMGPIPLTMQVPQQIHVESSEV